ncbi:unnamed protein product [Prorocentrum cordatum]|uniref:Aminotransferase class I/classII large domain-containing protein n=1 Tax=Prorocentrum cordatum TaxID=2364126 RepID=A0ABN9Y9Q2_9DINO|nr:unnamed protein product [Polarella glacialis]
MFSGAPREEGILSLAQGIVHWAPPPAVAAAVVAAAADPESSAYGADDGTAELRAALKAKLRTENALDGVEVMVTAGANQAFTNVVIAVLDADDGAVLFSPFYFNHMMALQMTGGGASVIRGPVREDFLPDVEWLERRLAQDGGPRIRMVTLVNPCNPTGIMAPAELLSRASAACARHGAWLVVDNTYELFSYEAYGMMGWRVGYIAYPPRLHGELMKAQDTIAICPAVASQKAAFAAAGAGAPWVKERVAGLSENKRIVCAAIDAALGEGQYVGGSGAIYLMVRLPSACGDDIRADLELAIQVCVIPGSACGAPGTVRVCYANLVPERCREAAARLQAGLRELCERGAAALA